MKIFSNFNTRFADKTLKNYQKAFSKESVFISRRSKYYLLLYIIPHFLWYLAMLFISFLIFSFYSLDLRIYICVFLVWLVIFWFRIVYKFLKYICDFTIVIHSVLKELPAKRIKAVEIFRPSFLWNVFGYGSVNIIADMDDSRHLDVDNEAPWMVELTYVDAPHIIKSRISEICFK